MLKSAIIVLYMILCTNNINPAVKILEGTEGRSGVIYVKRNRKRERDFR